MESRNPTARATAHQENNQQDGGGGGNQGPPAIDDRPVYDTIDYVYDQSSEGDVAANDTIRGSDFTSRASEYGHETASNEILEVFGIEYLPAVQSDGTLHRVDSIRLAFDSTAYDDLRYREFMLGFFGPDHHLSTPPLGVPVLSGSINPDADPFTTATPKVGPSTNVSPELNNNGTAIDDSFTIRLHVFRWDGSANELSRLIQAMYGTSTFQQNIRMTNPFTGTEETFRRSSSIQIAGSNAHGAFTELTGGVEQSTPKVRPWVTWSENTSATSTNTLYKFDQALDNVDQPWKELDFDHTDGDTAHQFNYVQVNQPDELEEAKMVVDERDRDPIIKLPPTTRHQLPTVWPMIGNTPRVALNMERDADDKQVPVSFGTTRDMQGREIGHNLLDGKQMIWDDGGGFRIRDNGNQLPANNVVIGVQGRVMYLDS